MASSLTVIYNEDNEPIVRLFLKDRGHPNDYGTELLNYLSISKLINGIGSEENTFKVRYHNGLDDLAANLAIHFLGHYKLGTFYIVPKDINADYKYKIYKDKCLILNWFGEDLETSLEVHNLKLNY